MGATVGVEIAGKRAEQRKAEGEGEAHYRALLDGQSPGLKHRAAFTGCLARNAPSGA
jgi:hypothetical protein